MASSGGLRVAGQRTARIPEALPAPGCGQVSGQAADKCQVRTADRGRERHGRRGSVPTAAISKSVALCRRVSLWCWFAVTAKQRTHLRLAEPPVPAWGTDASDPSGSRPAGDGLRIYPEQGSHLSRREQALVVAVHVQSPPTVSPEPPVRYASSLALNEYFLPRFLEISGLRLAK
jgi:hypothetical protein